MAEDDKDLWNLLAGFHIDRPAAAPPPRAAALPAPAAAPQPHEQAVVRATRRQRRVQPALPPPAAARRPAARPRRAQPRVLAALPPPAAAPAARPRRAQPIPPENVPVGIAAELRFKRAQHARTERLLPRREKRHEKTGEKLRQAAIDQVVLQVNIIRLESKLLEEAVAAAAAAASPMENRMAECTVCRADQADQSLPCGHLFCAACVGLIRNTCAMCRTKFVDGDVRQIYLNQ